MIGFKSQAQSLVWILDADQRNPVVAAEVYFPSTENMLFADQDGRVRVEVELLQTNETLIISALGYTSTILNTAAIQDTFFVYLQALEGILSEILITEDHAKHEHTLSSIHLDERYFQRNNAGTISQALMKIPGIQSMDMGPGVGKPMVRGLFGNRIIINKDYIKQEGHQWGTDHGLEIDPFDVERMEIVKGPASLQYGSDGLGGVINILPPLLPKEGEISGQFRSVYKSNNNHKAGSLQLSARAKDWFFTTRASIQDFEDYRIPADSFVYNGFELPLFNRRIKNTAGREQNLSMTIGRQTNRNISRFSYNIYDLKAGIFSGAVGIPRSYVLTDDGDAGNIDVPFQEVRHQRWVFNHISFWGNKHWTLNLGYQNNRRREHSLPESHSQFDIAPNETLAVGLDLQTVSYETHYEWKSGQDNRWVLGSNGQYQDNRRSGFEFLLPDFQLWRTGLFLFTEQEAGHDWMWTAGARYDLGSNRNPSFFMERRNRQGILFATTEVAAIQNIFHNYSASAGLFKEWKDTYYLRANIGKTFRIPYPNETSSNGIHHGNFRHEQGNPDLVSEQGYQTDLSLEKNSGNLRWAIASFFNYFDNYIYLRPTARFSNLPEAGLLFEYVQNDAIYTGFEAEWSYDWASVFQIRQSYEFVHSFNLQSRLALPFTPPMSILTEISRSTTWRRVVWEATLAHHFFGENGIKRVDRFERPTPAFHLFDLFLQVTFTEKWEGVSLQFQVNNLFDTPYLNHISRYRLLNLPEQGRNLILSLRIPVSANLRQKPRKV